MSTVIQAVIPAAGLGTRFLPLTKVVPKELLPLGTKPAIAYAVDECLDAGIREICFVISRGKELIPEYFRKDVGWKEELHKRGKQDALRELLRYDDVSFHVVEQDEQIGDGHAVLQAKHWIRSDPFAVLFPDDLILAQKGCLRQMVEQYESGILFALLTVPREEASRYGIAEVDLGIGSRLGRVTKLVEKPAMQDIPGHPHAVMGRFLLPLSTLQVLETAAVSQGGERRIVDAIRGQMGRVPVAGYVFQGTRYDLGTPEGYREAVAAWTGSW